MRAVIEIPVTQEVGKLRLGTRMLKLNIGSCAKAPLVGRSTESCFMPYPYNPGRDPLCWRKIFDFGGGS